MIEISNFDRQARQTAAAPTWVGRSLYRAVLDGDRVAARARNFAAKAVINNTREVP